MIFSFVLGTVAWSFLQAIAFPRHSKHFKAVTGQEILCLKCVALVRFYCLYVKGSLCLVSSCFLKGWSCSERERTYNVTGRQFTNLVSAGMQCGTEHCGGLCGPAGNHWTLLLLCSMDISSLLPWDLLRDVLLKYAYSSLPWIC